MNGYEKLIKAMRAEGTKGKTIYQPRIGIMSSEKVCKVGDLDLDEDDLLISSHFKNQCKNKVNSNCSSQYGTPSSELKCNCNDCDTMRLKKNDKVLIMQVSDDAWVILCKVVNI